MNFVSSTLWILLLRKFQQTTVNKHVPSFSTVFEEQAVPTSQKRLALDSGRNFSLTNSIVMLLCLFYTLPIHT